MEFGGNRIATFDEKKIGSHSFAETPYSYRLVVLAAHETLSVGDLEAWVVFVLRGAAAFEGAGKSFELDTNASVLGDRTHGVVTAGAAGASLLVGGSAETTGNAPSVKLTEPGKHYRVDKPWGHELWITGDHPLFCLKEVMLRAGQRTSLQYHNHKIETNVLIQGDINLVYQSAGDPPPYSAGPPPVASAPLKGGSVINVTPRILHRIEALSDVLLYEVSTPHLDDVVRVQDDKARTDGRIEAEHAAAV